LEFSLDPSKFERGREQIESDVKKLKEGTQRDAAETEASTKKLTEVFTGLKREFLGFLGIAVGGAAARQFFDFLVNLDASTSRLSRTLGINISELNAWSMAAKQFGGTGQEVAGTIQRLGQEIWSFRFGVPSNLPGQLNQLGIDAFDEKRNPKSGVQVLRDLADWADRNQMPMAGKAAFLQRVIGLDETTINMIIRGRAELEKTLATVRQSEAEMKEAGRTAEEFQKNWATIESGAINAGRAIAGPFMRSLIDAVAKLKEWTGLLDKKKDLSSSFLLGEGWGTTEPEAPSGKAAPGRGGSNWGNFLSGLSFLESSQTGGGNAGSTAQGFFQFLRGTAARARSAGIADPRFGNYANQADRTKRYIEKFYPGAAAAIEKGDFKSASAALNKEWPSLPGGSQPQSAARYSTFAQELQGGGPRPPGGGGGNITVQNMNVYSKADDAAGISRDIKSNLERNQFTAQVPQGTQ
jgi:hypothetical protein